MTGMSQNPINEAKWETYMSTTDTGEILSLHRVPLEQFVHVADDNESNCMCGPTVTVGIVGGSSVKLVRHYALAEIFYEDDFDFLDLLHEDDEDL